MSKNVDERWVQMEIKGLMLDPSSNVPIVILREEGSQAFLPIWIGVFEANAIALELEKVESTRPMTHDLMANLLTTLAARVERIQVNDLSENTFFAQIVLATEGGGDHVVDARPSDAMALALRVEAPIFVARSVLEKAKADEMAEHLTDEEKLKKILEDLDPDDMGEYTM